MSQMSPLLFLLIDSITLITKLL